MGVHWWLDIPVPVGAGLVIVAGAVWLAVASRHDGERRGLLLTPAVLGAFVLTFVLAEVFVPR